MFGPNKVAKFTLNTSLHSQPDSKVTEVDEKDLIYLKD